MKTQGLGRKIKAGVVSTAVVVSSWTGYSFYHNIVHEKEILKQVISRLESDSRVAEVLVTGINYDEITGINKTRIKFLEYDVDGKPMEPKYFEFSGNIIQFQSLLIRFNDIHIRNADALKGKSAHLFLKVFMLNGKDTEEYQITETQGIPSGYKVEGLEDPFEQELWEDFWGHALNPDSESSGIKNAQIEAPGTMFVPGIVYTINIEHDGGLRIDSSRIPKILRGEKIE